MARIEVSEVVLDKDGHPISGATVSIVKASDASLATLYLASAGAGTISNPVTTVDGRIEAWVDQGSYDLQVAAGLNYQGYVQRFQAVDADSVGSGGGGTGISVKDAGSTIASRTAARFLGSGGVGVAATDDGGGQATVTIGPPSGGTLRQVQAVGGSLYGGRETLRFQASGGVTLAVSDDGSAQSTVTVFASGASAPTAISQVKDADHSFIASLSKLRVQGSGGVGVSATDDGGGQATVTVGPASGGTLRKVQKVGGTLYGGRETLRFQASAGVGLNVTDDGAGQSTVSIGPASGGTLSKVQEVGGTLYGGREKLRFQASGGATLGVSDDGAGQSTITVAAATGGASVSAVGSAGVDQTARSKLRFIGSGHVDVSVVDDGSGQSTIRARYMDQTRAWMPSGAVGVTMNRIEQGDNDIAGALVSGRLALVGGAVIPAGVTVSAITFVSGVTGASAPTNCWFCLVDPNDNTVLAKTSDAGSLAWGSTTKRTLLLSAPYTPVVDLPVYLGIMVKATTPPSLRGLSRSSSWVSAVGPPWPAAYADTGLTNPASLGATTAALTGDTATALAWMS